MTRKYSLLLLPVLLAGTALVLTLLSNSQAQALPNPVLPEPDPFSDRYPAEVTLDSSDDLEILLRLEIDIDTLYPLAGGVFPRPGDPFEKLVAKVYVNDAEAGQLASQGLSAVPIPNESLRAHLLYGPGSDSPNAWPIYAQYVTRMQNLVAAYPNLVQMVSIGQSVQNRDIWMLKISDNPVLDEDEPEFKYTSTMHGDETVGVELVLRLAELLASSYGIDPRLTALVDEMEIWLCPIHNPDGYEAGSRYNANGIDLNRNFPDRITDPYDNPSGRQPETQAFMYFGYGRRFVMGANYHGGAQVVNVPWDSVSGAEYAPDDALFLQFGENYAFLNPMIWNGGFPDGVTRGWEWYIIRGGMQDWAYYWRGEHHVTIEVSNIKKPPYEQMDSYWTANREAMLWWMEQALTGMRGRVLDARNSDPLDALVAVNGMGSPNIARTDPQIGDYHRVIWPNTYTLTTSAAGYQSQSRQVIVVSGQSTLQDFALCPSSTWTVSGTVTQARSGLPLEASIELLGSPVSASTNPVDGAYQVDVCPFTYTLRASAPLYRPEERQVVVDQNQRQDFVLELLPDLSPSTKQASRTNAAPGEDAEYQVVARNSGNDAKVSLTDTLPAGVSWTGYLTATQGTPSFASGQVFWTGDLAQDEVVTLTYGVSIDLCQPAGAQLTNLVLLDDHNQGVITRSATLTVRNLPPGMAEVPYPADGSVDQPRNTTLTWVPAADPNCDLLSYDLAFGDENPPPLVASGLVASSYAPGWLLPNTLYYWRVTASDGISQTIGETWNFITEDHSPLAYSQKSASLPEPLPEGSLEYQLLVQSMDVTTTVRVTDTLSVEVSWNGELTATSGTASFSGGNVYWQGSINPGEAVTLTYGVSLHTCLAAGTAVINQAELVDGLGGQINRAAYTQVGNAAPTAPPLLQPFEGAQAQPQSVILTWGPSQDLNCDFLTYSIAFGMVYPPPVVAVGISATHYDPGLLLLGTTYYWSVIANDGVIHAASATRRFTVGHSVFLPVVRKALP